MHLVSIFRSIGTVNHRAIRHSRNKYKIFYINEFQLVKIQNVKRCTYTIEKADSVRPPTEDAFIGTSKTRRCLHAAMALNAVECVLVTAATSSQHRLHNNMTTY